MGERERGWGGINDWIGQLSGFYRITSIIPGTGRGKPYMLGKEG